MITRLLGLICIASIAIAGQDQVSQPERLQMLAREAAQLLWQKKADQKSSAYREMDFDERISTKVREAGLLAKKAKKNEKKPDIAKRVRFRARMAAASLLAIGLPMVWAIGNIEHLSVLTDAIIHNRIGPWVALGSYYVVSGLNVVNIFYLLRRRSGVESTFYDSIWAFLKNLGREGDGGFRKYFLSEFLQQSPPEVRIEVRKRIAEECEAELGDEDEAAENKKVPGKH